MVKKQKKKIFKFHCWNCNKFFKRTKPHHNHAISCPWCKEMSPVVRIDHPLVEFFKK